jgi:kumamolisin
VFAAARARGVTVFAASGDTGSRDGTSQDVADYPASDPSVVGCGGTRLVLNADGTRSAEVTWDDDDIQSATGGGVSAFFPGRHVPDVAGNADPVTGYDVVVDGQSMTIGGTSAVAPLYASMSAVVRQAYGQSWDWLNTVTTNPTICYDVTVGDNGGYKAGPGRDDVTGLGVVDMGKLLAVLTSGTQIPAPGGGTPRPAPVSGPVAAAIADVLAAADRLRAVTKG